MRWAPHAIWAVIFMLCASAACSGDDDGATPVDGGARRDAGRSDSGGVATDAGRDDSGGSTVDAGPVVVDCEADAPPARVVRVASVEELESAVRALAPGDEVRVADGVYSLDAPLAIAVRATAEQPVMIRAETMVPVSGAFGPLRAPPDRLRGTRHEDRRLRVGPGRGCSRRSLSGVVRR